MELALESRLVLESTDIEIVVLDLDYNIIDANPACLEKTGKHREVIIGQSAREIWDEPSYQQITEDLQRQRSFHGEVRELSPEGERRIVHYNISSVKNNGHLEGYAGFGRPVLDTDHYEAELQQRMEQLRKTQGAAMVGLAKLAEIRDPETGLHLERMSNYSRLIAEEMSTLPDYDLYITEDYIQDIYNSSPLHDIGKVGIPDAILLKPGRLTPEEFEIMKEHSAIGGDALRAADKQLSGESFLTLGKEIAYHHHEKWDGSGYPDGLANVDIPLSARIVALADVYDALTSKRVYKEAVSHDQARAIILESSGSHFDENIVRTFLKREQEFLKVQDRFKD
ncbi:hypothetical protein CEE37_14765 [candidate division LCP-89 bacterium B3_LCP]|uniref:Uncharacterized protein n=1 Tax=candidate division LCP-89 bacterium B3_LCP TaxID=2012998 RepID=A0A532UPK0_UNCL8|nr:MAG: hypothetical protein CEE37_14765 [candidate division LCP-89 bacterium B3_LCP]